MTKDVNLDSSPLPVATHPYNIFILLLISKIERYEYEACKGEQIGNVGGYGNGE